MNTIRTFLLLLLAAPCILCAQNDTAEHETLLSGNIVHGGYGGPVFRVTSIKNSSQIVTGGYGGWLINHTFMIGLGGYGMVDDITAGEGAPLIDGKLPTLNIGYGGLTLEYIIAPEKLIHFTIQSLIGAGGASYINLPSTNSLPSNTRTGTAFFVAELGVNAQLNIASFCRLSAGVNYRFANGVKLAGLSNKDVSGPAGNIALVFGKF